MFQPSLANLRETHLLTLFRPCRAQTLIPWVVAEEEARDRGGGQVERVFEGVVDEDAGADALEDL